MSRTRKPVGIHWCGGYLFKDGRQAVRCANCDRVKIIRNSETREELKRQLDERMVIRRRKEAARREEYFK